MKVAFIIPIMKKVDKKVSNSDTFFIFVPPLILTVYLKTYIMKKKNRSLKPYSVLVAEKIVSRIDMAKHCFISVDDSYQAYNEYIEQLKYALDDLEDLKHHLESLISIARFNQPLPF